MNPGVSGVGQKRTVERELHLGHLQLHLYTIGDFLTMETLAHNMPKTVYFDKQPNALRSA